ncbi:MAG: glycosyltransferase family 4 protein [Thalassobaculum sp.]|uniref:glycosyltransferase family 4 protein n=1 Tax=Thalassobaculum sp. TaxID=2022740 RepID=UPI0032EF6018
MARVLFGMIDNHTRPIGGVKVVYQAVGGLRRRGIDAYVATARPRPTWLAGSRALEDVELVDMSQPQRLSPMDLYIATDAIGPHRMPLLLNRPDRRVIFVQNHHALTQQPLVDWSQLSHIRCLTVSEYSRRVLLEGGWFSDVAMVPPGVDTSMFRPSTGPRHHRIAYMPRKWPALAERLRAHHEGIVDWIAIDGATETETAEILAGSTIFLNLGRNEGFGLPPLEAMASGCLVCGFAGQGTGDYATSENGFWAAEGDIAGCLDAIAAAVAAIAEPDRAERMIRAGIATAQRYSLTAFEGAMAAYVRSVL